MGSCYLELGKMEESLECFKRAIRADASNPNPHNNIAQLYIECGEFAEALPYAEAALKINAKLPQALNAMTISFFKDGTIEGRIATGPFTGKWAANGEDRTISITQLKYNGSPSGKSKEFMEALKNAAYYKGDSNYLKLAPQEKKSYVQLGHYSK
jgi:tetratricopeptide (TPR) repeat protein